MLLLGPKYKEERTYSLHLLPNKLLNLSSWWDLYIAGAVCIKLVVHIHHTQSQYSLLFLFRMLFFCFVPSTSLWDERVRCSRVFWFKLVHNFSWEKCAHEKGLSRTRWVKKWQKSIWTTNAMHFKCAWIFTELCLFSFKYFYFCIENWHLFCLANH